ncbi:uncharacterized protein LOC127867344 [Dreissena polymorpha]|uniref:Uncharacterized protein n=1 Tax=Dreissena polymorpha TaxID=45954 RepID=A0A9D4S3B9_DREPO|nr:uncharacterized protein LOC127867344 [Dreissena polymorpha]KAH3891014.1 hypothetical protein DPMN_015105 [Dreissena polymorpha]
MVLVLKVAVICLALIAEGYARPCGDNPLQIVDQYSQLRGINAADLMVHLLETSPFDYHRLRKDYSQYVDCTRAIQSGYYKRSAKKSLTEEEDNIRPVDEV